jgi:hypothetical protein
MKGFIKKKYVFENYEEISLIFNSLEE